ncbi:hypothetical protein HD806DRAFT_527442 [Xylariaceae sp. AK1471]|nr:hypothetical protein HD806DRAFT_527442 [Xylariaceae sp. AK1471]
MVSTKSFLLALCTSATVMAATSEQIPLSVSDMDDTENSFSNQTDTIEAMGIPANGVLCQGEQFTADEVKMALAAAKYCMQGTTGCACRNGNGRKYPHTYHDGDNWFPRLSFQPYEMPLQHYEPYCDEAPDKYRVVLDPTKVHSHCSTICTKDNTLLLPSSSLRTSTLGSRHAMNVQVAAVRSSWMNMSSSRRYGSDDYEGQSIAAWEIESANNKLRVLICDGSKNAAVHLPAMAATSSTHVELDNIERVSYNIPFITYLAFDGKVLDSTIYKLYIRLLVLLFFMLHLLNSSSVVLMLLEELR